MATAAEHFDGQLNEKAEKPFTALNAEVAGGSDAVSAALSPMPASSACNGSPLADLVLTALNDCLHTAERTSMNHRAGLASQQLPATVSTRYESEKSHKVRQAVRTLIECHPIFIEFFREILEKFRSSTNAASTQFVTRPPAAQSAQLAELTESFPPEAALPSPLVEDGDQHGAAMVAINHDSAVFDSSAISSPLSFNTESSYDDESGSLKRCRVCYEQFEHREVLAKSEEELDSHINWHVAFEGACTNTAEFTARYVILRANCFPDYWQGDLLVGGSNKSIVDPLTDSSLLLQDSPQADSAPWDGGASLSPAGVALPTPVLQDGSRKRKWSEGDACVVQPEPHILPELQLLDDSLLPMLPNDFEIDMEVAGGDVTNPGLAENCERLRVLKMNSAEAKRVLIEIGDAIYDNLACETPAPEQLRLHHSQLWQSVATVMKIDARQLRSRYLQQLKKHYGPPIDFQLGDLVWTRGIGPVPWPAIISFSPMPNRGTGPFTRLNSDRRQYHVHFFGGRPSRQWLSASCLTKYTGGSCSTPKKKAKASYDLNDYKLAVEQADGFVDDPKGAVFFAQWCTNDPEKAWRCFEFAPANQDAQTDLAAVNQEHLEESDSMPGLSGI